MGGGGHSVEPPTKFSKIVGLDRSLISRGSWKEKGDDIIGGGGGGVLKFLKKKKIKIN